ncbi:MAG TPA: single-stranded-DNA-specific exonuclease RecJ [Candidatus Saccharimonadales bacterium]|nr:single-stranded-DNA-specific exonuclease RecJ [Candidatus Saccharimonadales bacterium]
MPEVRQSTQLSALVAQILAQRGYTTPGQIQEFLDPDYNSGLHDPFLLTGMAAAVERIISAIKNRQSIGIYGDYDIDGLTASAAMLDFLSSLGAKAEVYIPDRFEEGYGINTEALTKLKAKGIDLVISVDCGITSLAEADWARTNKLDLIITDHHSVPDQLPQALAVINPKQPGDNYPFKDLAGVGVAFKLIQGIQQKLGRPEPGQEKWLLDLVALGTVCDVVTLVGENRLLVKYGLKVMAKSRRVGLKALADVAGIDLGGISSYHLGFMLGPRLNAAGRLEHAQKALALLTATNSSEAGQLADYLDGLNQERRDQQAQILAEAGTQAERYQNDPILVLASPDWSHGIVGIVASKLVERWHKPVLIMQIMGDLAKGSARSTANFNLIENLRKLDERFVKLGGHHFAAGFTIKSADIEKLRAELIERMAAADPARSEGEEADLEVDNFSSLKLDLIREIDLLEPFGNGNPKPIIAIPNLKVVRVGQVGKDQKHLKLALADTGGETLTALGFNMADRHPNLSIGQSIEVKTQLVSNAFFGQPEPELVLISLQ